MKTIGQKSIQERPQLYVKGAREVRAVHRVKGLTGQLTDFPDQEKSGSVGHNV